MYTVQEVQAVRSEICSFRVDLEAVEQPVPDAKDIPNIEPAVCPRG